MNFIASLFIMISCSAIVLQADEERFTNEPFASLKPQKESYYRIRLINGDLLTVQYKEKGESTMREDSMMIESIIVKALIGELIAARDGEISPLITTPADERLLHRLVTEKTVTVNTTAAGGNASLMTMQDNAS